MTHWWEDKQCWQDLLNPLSAKDVDSFRKDATTPDLNKGGMMVTKLNTRDIAKALKH